MSDHPGASRITPLELERDIIPLIQLWFLNRLHGEITVTFHGDQPPRLALNARVHTLEDLKKHSGLLHYPGRAGRTATA